MRRSLSQKEIEEKEILRGRTRMSNTLSEANEEWKNRQLKQKRSIKIPDDNAEASPPPTPSPPPIDTKTEEIISPPPPQPQKPPKKIPGYMQSTKASRSGRASGDNSLETNEPILASSARSPRSPNSPNPPPPFESPDSSKSSQSSPASSAPSRRPSSATTSPRIQSGGTWSKTPMWAQAKERNKVKKAAAAASATATRSPSRASSYSPKSTSSSKSPKASPSPRSNSPRPGAKHSSSFRVNRESTGAKTPRANSTNRSKTPTLQKTSSTLQKTTAEIRPVRLYTTEDRMPIKCAKVCVEYIRVWLLLCAATPKELRSSRLARKIIDESTIVKTKKGASSNTTYRKLMRLVHPDSLVTLKGSEPTTALTLGMAGGLLRTFNAANEILDQHDKANDHAAAACLLAPGDYPPGGPPSARKRNTTLATHLFLLAEKLLVDPNQSSTDKATARLASSLEALRQVVPAHRAGMISDMLTEETKRAEDEKMEAKLAAKRAAIEAKAALIRGGAASGNGAAEDEDDGDRDGQSNSPSSVVEEVTNDINDTD